MNATAAVAPAQPVSPEIAIVIAAAVAATVGPEARIISVRSIRPGIRWLGTFGSPWSIEGRREIYASHRFR